MVRGARGAHNRCAASVYSSTSSTFDMRLRVSTVAIRIRCRVSSEWYADPNLTSLGAFLPGYCLTAATTSDSAPLATPAVPAAAKVPSLLTV